MKTEAFRFANLFLMSATNIGFQNVAAVSLDGCTHRASKDQANCQHDQKAKCAYLLTVT
jgi:hypothetical protein